MSFVSVIIPSRNEEKYIAKCLDSVISQDYPKSTLEVLVIDGSSEDKTKEIVKEFSLKHSFIRVLDNPNKFVPFALNIGIKEAKGDIILRMDAHAGYNPDYISKCVNYLNKYRIDNIGGTMKTISAKSTLIAKAIAACLSSFFGAASSFRTGVNKKTEVDTVFGGCYKKEVFKKIGLFNEKLLRSEDIELNKRLKKAGGKIILAPDIVSYYYPKTTLKDFLKHNFTDGFWATFSLKYKVNIFYLRHLIPLFFVLFFFLLMVGGFFFFWARVLFVLYFVFYILVSLGASFITALKEKDENLFFILPLVFAIRHFGYGIGSLWGLVRSRW